jgi:hypothetical protein
VHLLKGTPSRGHSATGTLQASPSRGPPTWDHIRGLAPWNSLQRHPQGDHLHGAPLMWTTYSGPPPRCSSRGQSQTTPSGNPPRDHLKLPPQGDPIQGHRYTRPLVADPFKGPRTGDPFQRIFSRDAPPWDPLKSSADTPQGTPSRATPSS